MPEYCAVDVCSQDAMPDGLLCVLCFEQKWGPNPLSFIPFPKCLIKLVTEYFSLQDCIHNLQCMYAMLPFCSRSFLKDTIVTRWKQAEYITWSMRYCREFTFKNELSSNPLFLPFIVDRYCFLHSFWTELPLKTENTFVCMLQDNKEETFVFAQRHPIPFSQDLFDYCCSLPTDEALWTFYTTNITFKATFPELCNWFTGRRFDGYTQKPLVDCITRWKSQRLLQQFVKNCFFADKRKARYVLRYVAMSEDSWNMFAPIWYIHFSDMFVELDHGVILETILKKFNFQALEFLAKLTNFHIPDDMLSFFMSRVTFDSNMRSFLIANKHIIKNDEWALYCSRWKVLLQLSIIDPLFHVDFDRLTEVCLQEHVFEKLLSESRKQDFLTLLSKITHLGNALPDFARLICKKCSLVDLQYLMSLPVIQPHLTFALLRETRPNFLSRMFANEPSLEHLQWISNFRDSEQQTITRADINANNNALMRFAFYTKNMQLSKWIFSF